MENTVEESLDILKASIEKNIGRIAGGWIYYEDSRETEGSLTEIHAIIESQSPPSDESRFAERRKTIILQTVKMILKAFRAKNARLRSVNDIDIVSVLPIAIDCSDSSELSRLSALDIDKKIDIDMVFKKRSED